MARHDDQKNFCSLALLVKFNQANSCKKSSLISKPLIFFCSSQFSSKNSFIVF